MSKIILIVTVLFSSFKSYSQIDYPFPSQKINLNIEGKQVAMSYMDIKPVNITADKTIVLLHGKNFNGYYWAEIIPLLTAAGYRVIVPDQVGWGKSDRVNLHYSFPMLANNTKILLDSLNIKKAVVLGHSMGGMLATRFGLMYPEMVSKLVLEDPIGLEDYKSFIPYQPIDSLFKKEKSATYASYKKYQQTYYPVWKPEYEKYVEAQAVDLKRPDFDLVALVNALTYQMIYEQPVCYEFDQLKMPTLLMIGQADRTVVGKEKLPLGEKDKYGNYPLLGKITQEKIKGSTLKKIEAVGHIPHVQDIGAFWKILEAWLEPKLN